MPAQVLLSETTLQGIHVMGGKEQSSSIPFRRLEGKVAIVTGGARGIGEAIVRLFVRHGAKVMIADIEDALGNALAASLSPCASYIHCDVSVEEDVQRLVDTTVAQQGKLDILINNAGVLGSQSKARKSILNFDPDEFDRIMSVNVKGMALGIKHAARVMRAAGSIISTASVAGHMGGLGPHAYTASKHAIVGITKNAACELGRHGIRVNCISPFGVATSMLINAWRGGSDDHDHKNNNNNNNEDDNDDVKMESAGLPNFDQVEDEEVEKMEEFVRGLATLKGPTLRPNDVAEAALYLASDESKYVSGHNLVLDGGFTTSINCVGL